MTDKKLTDNEIVKALECCTLQGCLMGSMRLWLTNKNNCDIIERV